MNKKDFVRVGKVTKCNRKTGELSLGLDTGIGEVFDEIRFVFFEVEGGLVPFVIRSSDTPDAKTVRMLAEDYDTPEKAQPLVGCPVYLPKADLEQSGKESYHIDDLIGYEVVDANAGAIGTLTGILEGPQQDLLQVDAEGKEILIPFVEEIFEKADPERKQLFIRTPEGLIDLYLGK